MVIRLFVSLLVLVALSGCSDNSSSNVLTINGSNSSTPVLAKNWKNLNDALSMVFDFFVPKALAVPIGTPTTTEIKIYTIWVSENADCTGATKILDNGAGTTVDMFQSPTLFSGATTPGTYHCVLLEMSDNVTFKADAAAVAADAGECGTTATDHTFDIYRHGEPDDNLWVDETGAAIDGTGSIAVPGDDRVFTMATTDVAAPPAGALNAHANQVIALSGALTVPSSATFFFNADNGIEINGGQCWLETVTMGFW